ncbi:hypothetical protein [Aeromonas simiae]|uniref:hypothetical protein n=1 Tax=Aeromonas simiae TaxID=218936 RepID=UPI001D012AFB|nr:hypothetical protein [Aeromonas simiae]
MAEQVAEHFPRMLGHPAGCGGELHFVAQGIEGFRGQGVVALRLNAQDGAPVIVLDIPYQDSHFP